MALSASGGGAPNTARRSLPKEISMSKRVVNAEIMSAFRWSSSSACAAEGNASPKLTDDFQEEEPGASSVTSLAGFLGLEHNQLHFSHFGVSFVSQSWM